MGKLIGAAEFKTHCLRIMKEIGRTGDAVTITHRGIPLVEIKPAESEPKLRTKFEFGFAKGWIAPDFAPEEPAYDGPWNAELDSDRDDPGADVR